VSIEALSSYIDYIAIIYISSLIFLIIAIYY
jgi:hypothetical protein